MTSKQTAAPAEIDYDALAARLSDPELPLPSPTVVRTGAAAAAAGREFMLREYGSQEAIDRALRGPGRPRVGSPAGASPTVRGRISDDDFAAFKKLEADSGRTQSELVREAVHQLLVRHKLVS